MQLFSARRSRENGFFAPPVRWGQFDSTYEAVVGTDNDANGRPILTKHPSAQYIYVRNGGSDANDGLSHANAKATLNGGWQATRDGFGDWVLVDNNSTFDDGFWRQSLRKGLSTTYPTVVTTYDGTDPTNTAKFRTGTFRYGNNPTAGGLYDLQGAGGSAFANYFENGRCIVPLATRQRPANALAYHAFLSGGSGDIGPQLMFYNFDFKGGSWGVQGDYLAIYDSSHNLTGNTTSGSNQITNVVFAGGLTPTIGYPINGRGPLTGIPPNATITAWNSATQVLTLSAAATLSATGMTAVWGTTRYWAKGIYFRHCTMQQNVANGHAQGIFGGAIDGFAIEDCVVWHNGFIGNRDDLADITMSANATSSGSSTITVSGAGTITATTTSGSAVLTNCVCTSGNIDSAGYALSGTGIPVGTTISAINTTINPDIFKHGMYFATSAINGKVKRCLVGQNSATGLQMRGGGQVSDNVFALNPIAFGRGSGDDYNASQPFGVYENGGHNIIIGAENQSIGYPRGFAFYSSNITGGAQVKNIICNRTNHAGEPYNTDPIGVSGAFDQPNYFNFDKWIVWNWGAVDTLLSQQTGLTYPNQNKGYITNCITDGDTTWNSLSSVVPNVVASGNIPSPVVAFPNPNRDLLSYAIANGFADVPAFWAYACANPTIKHASLIQDYIQAGFGY